MPLHRRSPLRANTPLKRRSPLRNGGRKPGRPTYTGPPPTAREVVLERDQYRCGVCGVSIFAAGTWNVHHRRNRGAGGSSDPQINALSNLLLVCGTGTTLCHGWIGERPAEARDLGYVVSLNSREDTRAVPVHHAVHGLVHLLDTDDEGGWLPAGEHPGTYRLAADLTHSAASDAPETADETPREDRKS